MTGNVPEKAFSYMITPGYSTATDYLKQKRSIISAIEQAVKAGVDLIQIREKRISTKQVLDLAMAALEVTRGGATRVLINDRSDVALAAGADGVHLTSTSIPVSAVRKHVGSTFLIGISCHTDEDVKAAAAGGASFAVFGPVFASPDKIGAVGVETLSRVCLSNKSLPVAALGGVTSENCRAVLDAGAAGVAGIRSFCDSEQTKALVDQLHASKR